MSVNGSQRRKNKIAEDEQLKARKKKYINKEFCSERSLLFCYGTFDNNIETSLICLPRS